MTKMPCITIIDTIILSNYTYTLHIHYIYTTYTYTHIHIYIHILYRQAHHGDDQDAASGGAVPRHW
jgi:hypothetical protein